MDHAGRECRQPLPRRAALGGHRGVCPRGHGRLHGPRHDLAVPCQGAVDPRSRDLFLPRAGRAEPDAARPHGVSRDHVRAGLLDGHPGAGRLLPSQPLPGPGRSERRLPRSRPVPLRVLLGADARPDVLPDRHLGAREPPPGRGEVLHLHADRRAAHARGHHRARRRARHGHRDSTPSTTASSSAHRCLP